MIGLFITEHFVQLSNYYFEFVLSPLQISILEYNQIDGKMNHYKLSVLIIYSFHHKMKYTWLIWLILFVIYGTGN